MPPHGILAFPNAGRGVVKVDDGGAVSTRAAAWWIAAASTNIFEDDRPPPSTALRSDIDLQMMAGETEHRQIVVRLPNSSSPLRNVTLSFAPLLNVAQGGPPLPRSALRWRQQGYVKCAQFFYETMRPAPGFFPDPLWLPSDGEAVVWPGVTASFWVSIDVPPGTAAGDFIGAVSVVSGGGAQLLARVPLRVKVWPIQLPPLASGRFTAIMSWIDSGDFASAANMTQLMTPAGGREAYWEWMCEHRMPPNKLYVAPSFNFHTAEGGRALQLLTNSSINGSVARSCGGRGGAGWISLGNVELLAGHRLQNYTDAQIAKALSMVAPTMAAAERLGVDDRVFAYGFDE